MITGGSWAAMFVKLSRLQMFVKFTIHMKLMERKSSTPYKLVLDLDSTLVHSSGIMEEYERLEIASNPKRKVLLDRLYNFQLVDVMDPPGTGMTTVMWGTKRPHLAEFLTFASTYFEEIIIWSAGQPKYVHAIADVIFPDTFFGDPTKRSIRILTSEDCVMQGRWVYKPISKLANVNPAYCFCLDDRDDTFSKNSQNGIKIPAYEPSPTVESIMADDVALVQLMCWLSLPEVMNASDVRQLNKKSIFTTPLSTYYAQIASMRSTVRTAPTISAPTLPVFQVFSSSPMPIPISVRA